MGDSSCNWILSIGLITFGAVLKTAFDYIKGKRQKFGHECRIKAELERIAHNLRLRDRGRTAHEIEHTYTADWIRYHQPFGQDSTQALGWYDIFEKYNKDFERLRDDPEILRKQGAMVNRMEGILKSSFLKKIPSQSLDPTMIDFIWCLLGQDAKIEA